MNTQLNTQGIEIGQKQQRKPNALRPRQKLFCQHYIIDWHGARAYKKAFGENLKDSVCRANASRLLAKQSVKAYINTLTEDLERSTGISKIGIILEHKKLAFSSIAHLHNTWIDRKAFDELSPDQKACISEISTQTRTVIEDEHPVKVEFVKVRLYDKQKSLDAISRIMGYEKSVLETPGIAIMPITGIQIINDNGPKA
jgi:phage terminase small subunit